MKTTLDLIINAGTHLGSSRVQRLMQANVYRKRHGRYVLNPSKTIYILKVAFFVIRHVACSGGKIIFYVSNPSFVKLIIPIFPKDSKGILLTGSWSSGTITNFEQIIEKGDVLPALLVTFQAIESKTPLAEAKRKGIPSISIFDSSDNPLMATYPIPGNSKSLKSFYLYARIFTSALSVNRLSYNYIHVF